MKSGFSYPWYYNVDEVFDAVLQVLQVCEANFNSADHVNLRVIC